MSDVIHTTTMEVRRSVHTPDFPAPDWKANPDLSAVAGVPHRYWKWDGAAERPVPMTTAEQAAVDAAASTAAESAALRDVSEKGLIQALALVLLDEVNALRTRAGLAARTSAQLRDAIATKYRSL